MTAVVTFSAAELLLINCAAGMRFTQNVKRGAKPRYGADAFQGRIDIDFLGCFGEAAVAKYLNRWWAGAIGDYSAADVGSGVQVRATTRPDGCLILHPADKSEQPAILVVAEPATATARLKGWIPIEDGKREQFWRDPTGKGRPAFFVPANELRPMDDFRAAA